MGAVNSFATCSYPDQASPCVVETVDRLLIPEHYAFQVCLLEVNESLNIGSQLVTYIQQARLEDLSSNLPVILTLISSCPFWLHRFRMEICHALNSRILNSEPLILSLYYSDSVNSSTKRRKLVNIPPTGSIKTAPLVGEATEEEESDDSVITLPPPSELLHYSYEYTTYKPGPVLKWWLEISETTTQGTLVSDVPSDVLLFDPIRPQNGKITRFKLSEIPNPGGGIPRKRLELYFRAPTNPDHFNLSSTIHLRSGPNPNIDLAIMNIFEYMNYIWFTRDNSFMNVIVKVKTQRITPLTQELGVFEHYSKAYKLSQVSDMEKRPMYKLIATAAGFYVACYVCGIHDRSESDLYILSDGSFYSHDFRTCLSQKTVLSVPLVFRKLVKERWDDFVSVCVMSFDMLRTDRKQLIEYAKLMFSQHDPVYVEKKISSRCTIEARNELCELLLSYN